MKALLAALVLAAGCMVGDSGPGPGGGTPTGGPTSPDAGVSNTGSNGDNQGSGSNSTLPACTGALYDPCTDNTQCQSASCKAFNGLGVEVCTTTCTPGDDTPCGAGTCNNMGICKPPAANACTR
jgi:hypothetical protein